MKIKTSFGKLIFLSITIFIISLQTKSYVELAEKDFDNFFDNLDNSTFDLATPGGDYC